MFRNKLGVSRYFLIPLAISALVAATAVLLVGHMNGWVFVNWSLPTSSSQETVTTGDIISAVISASGVTIPVIIGYVSIYDSDLDKMIYNKLLESMNICGFRVSDITPASVHYQSFVATQDDDAIVKSIAAVDYFSAIIKTKAKEKERFSIDRMMLARIVDPSKCDAFRRLFEERLDRKALIGIAYVLVVSSVFLFVDLLYRYHVPTNPNLSVADYAIVVFSGTLNIVCYWLILMSLTWRKFYQKEISDKILDICSISKGAIVVWEQYKESAVDKKISSPPDSAPQS